MSDIDPMTGQSFNAPRMEQGEAGPRVSFEGDVPSVVQTEEEEKFAHIARMSQKTKFATGNLDVDIRNYLAIKNIADAIVDLAGQND